MQSLVLSYNQLSDLPKGIGQLKNLRVLNLRSNKLSSLPASIGKLASLQSLVLSYNQLSELPPSIKNLLNLKQLYLQGNPLPIAPEMLANDTTANIVKFYFQSQNDEASESLYEAKFLIVGEGETGKTTLAKKLMDSNYELNQMEQSTEGIEVFPYDFVHTDGHSCRVNIWDFGGQEIYHATHQFFLTERSVYALVVDARKENPNFYYWLKVVQLHSRDSPIIIIKNEKQDRTCSVQDRQLKGEFSNLRESIATNLATNRNLDTIRAKIENYICQLPHVGDRIPKTWSKVRKVLETTSKSKNYIETTLYKTICKANGVTDELEPATLSHFLHDLGSILHFQHIPQLRKTIFLNPTWSTTAVYKVLDAPRVIQDCGRFCDADLDEIWSGNDYADMQVELLALMKEFEVCYEILGRKGHYIAPHLLDLNPPDYDPINDWDIQDNLIVTYRYNFKPRNIFPRLIVSLHRYIEKQRFVWKHGVVLLSDDARAEVTEDDTYKDSNIRIRISGQDKKRLLNIIAHELDKINDSFDNLEYSVLIPCNCSECKGSQTPYEFPYKVLHKSLAKKNYELLCHDSFEKVNVRQLIDGVVYESRASSNPMIIGMEKPNTTSPFTTHQIIIQLPSQYYQAPATVNIEGDVNDGQIIVGDDNKMT